MDSFTQFGAAGACPGAEVDILGINGPSVLGKWLAEDGSVYTQGSNPLLFQAIGHIPKITSRTSLHTLPANCVVACSTTPHRNAVSTACNDQFPIYTAPDGACVPFHRTTDGAVGYVFSPDGSTITDSGFTAYAGAATWSASNASQDLCAWSAYRRGLLCASDTTGAVQQTLYFANGGNFTYTTKTFVFSTEAVHGVAVDAVGWYFVTTLAGGKLYKSTDGTTWTNPALPGGWAGSATRLSLVAFDGALILTDITNGKIYRSTNNMTSWTDITPGGFGSISTTAGVWLCSGVMGWMSPANGNFGFLATGQTTITVSGPSWGNANITAMSAKTGNFFRVTLTNSAVFSLYWFDVTAGVVDAPAAQAQIASNFDALDATTTAWLPSQTVCDDTQYLIGEKISWGAPGGTTPNANNPNKAGLSNTSQHGTINFLTGIVSLFSTSFIHVGKVGAGSVHCGIDTSGIIWSLARPYDPTTQFQTPYATAKLVNLLAGPAVTSMLRPGYKRYIMGT